MKSLLNVCCRCLFPILVIIISKVSCIELETSNKDLDLEVGCNTSWPVMLKSSSKEAKVNLLIYTNVTNTGILEVLPSEQHVILNMSNKIEFVFHALRAGHTVVIANGSVDEGSFVSLTENSTDLEIRSNAFVRVSVKHYSMVDTLSTVIGWIYFCAWTISFYPQIYINWRRKSVLGLNFDFVGLNFTGFLSYSVFNICLYFIHPIQEEYLSVNQFGLIPVELNDVVFAVHAFLATTATAIQCLIYERGNQRLSRITIAVLGIIYLAAAILPITIVFRWLPTSIPWLTYMYFFSYVKLGITLSKYCPQAYFNYKRKSTSGWSIGNILLDCTGGVFSILQLFLLAYNYDDWWSLFGNFTKFGLGAISILFDILFIIQHYVLYRERGEHLLTAHITQGDVVTYGAKNDCFEENQD